MGTPDDVPSVRGTPVVIGKCAQAFRDVGVFVPGCPPHGFKITDGACEALDIDKEVVRKVISNLHSD